MPSKTGAAPSGEAQTYTQARSTAAAYHDQAHEFQGKAADAKVSCEQLVELLETVQQQLVAGGVGERTLGPIGGALEHAREMEASAAQLIASCADAITGATTVDTALATHAGIYEAANANTDGGDRQYHGGDRE